MKFSDLCLEKFDAYLFLKFEYGDRWEEFAGMFLEDNNLYNISKLKRHIGFTREEFSKRALISRVSHSVIFVRGSMGLKCEPLRYFRNGSWKTL